MEDPTELRLADEGDARIARCCATCTHFRPPVARTWEGLTTRILAHMAGTSLAPSSVQPSLVGARKVVRARHGRGGVAVHSRRIGLVPGE